MAAMRLRAELTAEREQSERMKRAYDAAHKQAMENGAALNAEREAHAESIRYYSREITGLHADITALKQQLAESQEIRHKLASWTGELRSQKQGLEAELARVRGKLEKIKTWNHDDAVLGNGDYDQGLLCGVEDRGLQTDGYAAMRYGYDRAIARVGERIDGLIEQALAQPAPTKADP